MSTTLFADAASQSRGWSLRLPEQWTSVELEVWPRVEGLAGRSANPPAQKIAQQAPIHPNSSPDLGARRRRLERPLQQLLEFLKGQAPKNPSGKQPTARAVGAGIVLLIAYAEEDLPQPQVLAAVDRSIHLRWEKSGRAVELTALPDGKARSLQAEGDRITEGELALARLEETRRVLRWLDETNTRAEKPFVLLSALTRRLLASTSRNRASWRTDLAVRLRSEPEADKAVLTFVGLCVAEGGPDGMDVGIDVLSEIGTVAFGAARSFLAKDKARWSSVPKATLERQDDFWHILLRGLARSHPNKQETLAFLREFEEAGHRGLRVALAEALGDLGTAEAAARLREMLPIETDSLVRTTIEDTLADMEQ